MWTHALRPTFAAMLAVGLGATSFAQAVELDVSYANGGRLSFAPPGFIAQTASLDVAVTPDDKAVMLGALHNGTSFVTLVHRALPDGSPDLSFGDQGYYQNTSLSSHTNLHSLVVQQNGKVILCGERFDPVAGSLVQLIRLDQNGIADTGFGVNGKVEMQIGQGGSTTNDVAMLPDGRVLVLGTDQDRFFILCLLPNGQVDQSFGTNGVSRAQHTSYGLALAVDEQPRILVAAATGVLGDHQGFSVSSILSNGVIDAGYGMDGSVIFDELPNDPDHKELIAGLSCDRDGRAFIAAHSTAPSGPISRIIKLDGTGNLDLGFGDQGQVVVPQDQQLGLQPSSIAIAPNGDVLLSGNVNDPSQQIFLFRADEQGEPVDMSGGGSVNYLPQSHPWELSALSGGMDVQSTGRILISAAFQFQHDGLIALAPLGSNPTNIAAVVNDQAPSLYPNPAYDHFSISGQLNTSERTELELFDVTGRKVSSYTMPLSRYVLSAELQAGRYFVRFSQPTSTIVLPLVIER